VTPIWLASDRIDARYLMTLGYLFYAAFGLCMMLRICACRLCSLDYYFGRLGLLCVLGDLSYRISGHAQNK